MNTRTEHDMLGEMQIPNDRYFGAQTLRAVKNFYISGTPMSSQPKLIQALATVKQATAMANLEMGLLERKNAEAIIQAAEEIIQGSLHEHFPVDMIQGGAGTSANMNINEVVCNRALEILGHQKGEYEYLHPLNHVNLSQSTNDVVPTAMKIAIIWLSEDLIAAMVALRDALFAKAEEFKSVIKMGRTQLQDAVPMTLGQEFRAFGVSINEDIQNLRETVKLCYLINIGATAIGTAINTVPGYIESVCRHLSQVSGLKLSNAIDLVESTSDAGTFVSVSSALKRMAIRLTKLCNDLRLLSSGPQAGLGDIQLPPMQPGSSIMPGKVNPVIPEVVNQIGFQVMGNDLVITMAAAAGQLQLNAFLPIILYNICDSIKLLQRGCLTLKEKCIDGITANIEKCAQDVHRSAGLLTALTPVIGYEAAATIAKKVQHSNKTAYELLQESGLLTAQEIETLLSPEHLINPQAQEKMKK